MMKLVLTETAVARGQRAVLPLGYETCARDPLMGILAADKTVPSVPDVSFSYYMDVRINECKDKSKEGTVSRQPSASLDHTYRKGMAEHTTRY